jgi:hypothetical protein
MRHIALAVCAALTVPSIAAAGPGSRHEAARDGSELRDDLRDEQRAQQLLNDFDASVRARNWFRMRLVEASVTGAMDSELRELNQEVAEAGHEARQSNREVQRDRMELARDAREDDRREFRGDRRELRDDLRDRQDDRRDFAWKAASRDHLLAMRNEWQGLRGRRDPFASDRKHRMLVQLVEYSRREIRADVSEVREDRRERREDRREWWEEHR